MLEPILCCTHLMQDAQPSTSGRQGQSSVWAAIINFERQGRAENGEAEARSDSKKAPRYIVDVLANCAEDSLPGRGPKRCCFKVLPFPCKQAGQGLLHLKAKL